MKTLSLLLLSSAAMGQAIHLSGGESTLLTATGGGATAYLGKQELYVGGGRGISISDKFEYRHLDFTLGDDIFAYSVSGVGTSVFNRGVQVAKTDQIQTIGAFAGLTGLAYQVPFFRTLYQTRYPGVGVFYKRKMGSWKFSGLEVFSRQKTMIQSAEYDGTKLSFFANGGIVSNRWQTGGTFIFRPDQHIAVTGSHINQYQYNDDDASLSASFGGLQANGSFISNSYKGKNTEAYSAGAQDRWKWFTVRSDYYNSSGHQQVLNTLMEQTSRWMLTESISSANQFQVGMSYHTRNGFAVGFNHAIIFVPGEGYRQVLSFQLGLHIRDTSVNGQIYRMMDKSIKWSGWGDQWLQGPLHVESAGHQTHRSIGKFVQSGQVIRKDGTGVEGIAVQVGTEVVYTDRNGIWVYRSRKKTNLPVKIVLDESLAPGDWKVISESPSRAVVANQ